MQNQNNNNNKKTGRIMLMMKMIAKFMYNVWRCLNQIESELHERNMVRTQCAFLLNLCHQFGFIMDGDLSWCRAQCIRMQCKSAQKKNINNNNDEQQKKRPNACIA